MDDKDKNTAEILKYLESIGVAISPAVHDFVARRNASLSEVLDVADKMESGEIKVKIEEILPT